MPKLLIEVTQEDIDKGERSSGRKCPVSHALRRQVKGWKEGFEVGGGAVYEPKATGIRLAFALPYITGRMITSYDLTGVMRPFAFEVVVPDELCDDSNSGKAQGGQIDGAPSTSVSEAQVSLGGVEGEGSKEVAGDGNVDSGGSSGVGGVAGDQPRG